MSTSVIPHSSAVNSAEDLSKFILRLREDFLTNPSDWEILEAMSAWPLGIEAYHKNLGRSFSGDPSWRLVAQMLAEGSIYE